MKNWQIFGVFTFLIIGTILISGCTQDNNKYCSDNFPGTVYDPSSKMCEHTPTPISSEPIVGIWQWTAVDGSKVYTFTFFSDGNFSFTDSSDPKTLPGTWSKVRENEYLIAYTSGKNQALLYHPTTDTFTMPEFSVIVYRLGKEPVSTFTSSRMTIEPIKGVERSTANIQIVGSVFGLASNPSAGINEIRFSIGLAPGAPAIDLTKMKIVFSTPTTIPIILTQDVTASTSVFTTKLHGATQVNSMKANEQVEITFFVAPVGPNTKMNIELRPSVGAALPFSKTAPPTISANNVLY